MFKIYEFRYKDKKSGLGFVFYARKEEFADSLADKITALGIYNLKRKIIGYKKICYTDIAPYELELEQEEYVEEMEKRIQQRCVEGKKAIFT